MNVRILSSYALLAVTTVAIGCSAPDAAAPDAESVEAALSTCTPANYDAALVHYKNAVAWSKDRLEHGVCETENGYQMTIADAASRAVTTCGAFRETIRTSAWAAPLRKVLGDSLTLRSLTGELLVIKDSPFQNWRDTEQLIAKGITFWANANGAYGPPYQIDLGADGKATWGYLHFDEVTGDITWKTLPATYRVTKIDGTEKGKRLLTVTHGSVTETFKLGVDGETGMTESAPVFTLTPVDTAQPTAVPLFSIMSECDA